MCRLREWNNDSCSYPQSEYSNREEWHKSSTSALRGALQHLQTCHYCSSWNEHQKRGRSPTVTFRKLPYHRFDISNRSRFKHAVFEDSRFLENVKNNTDTLQKGRICLCFIKQFSWWNLMLPSVSYKQTRAQRNVFSFCILRMHLSDYHWSTMQSYISVCTASGVQLYMLSVNVR